MNGRPQSGGTRARGAHSRRRRKPTKCSATRRALRRTTVGHAGIDRTGRRCGRRRSLRRIFMRHLRRDLGGARGGRSTVSAARTCAQLEISPTGGAPFRDPRFASAMSTSTSARAARARARSPRPAPPAAAPARCASLRPVLIAQTCPRCHGSAASSRTRRAMLRQRPHQAAENLR